MKNWENICTLSLVHFMAFPELQSGGGDFVGTLRQVIRQNFFGALEMGLVNDPMVRADILNLSIDSGIKIGFGAQPLILGEDLNLNDQDAASRYTSVEKVKTAVKQAYDIGADRFVILSGKDPGIGYREEAYQVFEESIVEIGKYAGAFGIRLVLETFDRNVDKKALVGPSEEAALFTQRVRRRYPEFGLLYDMGHMPLLNETPEKVLPILKDTLVEVHLGNCVLTPGQDGYGDKHPRFGFPGGENGTHELVKFLKILFQIGFLSESSETEELPWVGFEIRPFNGETSQMILDNIEKTWRDAWDQL